MPNDPQFYMKEDRFVQSVYIMYRDVFFQSICFVLTREFKKDVRFSDEG